LDSLGAGVAEAALARSIQVLRSRLARSWSTMSWRTFFCAYIIASARGTVPSSRSPVVDSAQPTDRLSGVPT
jgi:hypothetical protein